MIITQLLGGLGNQLFQYAMGRQVAQRLGVRLKLDLSMFKDNNRKFTLANFNINAEVTTSEELEYFAKYSRHRGLLGRFYNLKAMLGRGFIEKVEEADFSFDPDTTKIKDNSYLCGYWQSEKYFSEIQKELKEEITLKPEKDNLDQGLLGLITSSDSVSLHIRRGDYITNKKAAQILGSLPVEYYLRALKITEEKIKTPHFFIFSDDINWAKEKLKLNFPITFVSNNQLKDYEELILMSKCKYNIIANSSFSWWGAWLNSNPDKFIIVPLKWFKDTSINIKDLIPDSWIKI